VRALPARGLVLQRDFSNKCGILLSNIASLGMYALIHLPSLALQCCSSRNPVILDEKGLLGDVRASNISWLYGLRYKGEKVEKP
jgi:hypothetical protein